MYLIAVSLIIITFSIIVAGIYSYLVLQRSDLVKEYRTQTTKYQKGILRKRYRLIAFNIFLLLIFTASGLYIAQDFFTLEMNSWGIYGLQVLIVMLIDDAWFYLAHRTLHENKYLFQKIHRIHHRSSPSFALEFIYVHPLEWMVGALGFSIGLVVCYFSFGAICAYAFWTYAFYRNVHEVHIHSGIRSGLTRFIPFYGTVEHHDDHHTLIDGNYASTFTIWDKMLGTGVSTKKKAERKTPRPKLQVLSEND